MGLLAGYATSAGHNLNWNHFDIKSLTASKTVPIDPLTAERALRALIDFTLSNARRFYSSMGNPLAGKGLKVALTSIVK